jgi:hypothetical protein
MSAVHREVAALPQVDRSAFILNVLEGLTQAETAVRLGRTPGVVAGQVARAKKRLVTPLTRRGVVPGLVAIGTASVAGAVPPGLVARVLALADTAAGKSLATVISAEVAALTEGVMKAMLLNKLAKLTALLVALTLVTFTGLLAKGYSDDMPQPARITAPEATDDKKAERGEPNDSTKSSVVFGLRKLEGKRTISVSIYGTKSKIFRSPQTFRFSFMVH